MKRAASLFVALVIAPVAQGQLVPPPAPKSPPLPVYVPAEPETAEPEPTPEQPQAQPEPQTEEPVELPSDLYADTEYETIVVRDEQGKVVRYRNPELVALLANPAFTPKLAEILDSVLQSRAATMRAAVAANPASILSVKSGQIDTININEPATMLAVVNSTRPLIPSQQFMGELLQVGLVDRPTAALTRRIYNEYQRAVFEEFDTALGGSEDPRSLSAKAAVVFAQQMGEALDAFDQLAVTVAADPEGIFADASVDLPDLTEPLEAGSADETSGRVANLLSDLSPEDAGAVLTAANARLSG